MALRQSYERRELTEVRWIDGKDNPADAMTKSNASAALERLVSANNLTIRMEAWNAGSTRQATTTTNNPFPTNAAANGYAFGPPYTTEIPSVTVGIEPTSFGGPGLARPQEEVAVLGMVHLEEFPGLRMPDHDRWPPPSEPPTLVDEDSLTTALIETMWGTRCPCLSTRPGQLKGPVLGQSCRILPPESHLLRPRTSENPCFGIVGMQTDDTFGINDAAFDDLEESKLKEANLLAKPKTYLSPGNALMFNGGIVSIDENGKVGLKQKGQGLN
ncbi:hypothetical protein CSHISOI_08614 [Colletotrichum shisoi]|uniref:Uncharacterized protein n=1 Tax=Colletotrichum shisoi TaxID=2078593 RepID=A0A5Q4BJR0_9PEZI|nr:hypothetical protein CSHISOI_08614 [Colletotrichum shisoi]